MRTTNGCGGPGDYEQGAQPVVRAVYTTVPEQGSTVGVLFDPSSITVTTKSPSGIIDVYTTPSPQITSSMTGYWDFTFPDPLVETGKWVVTFVADGSSKSTWFALAKAAVFV